MSEAVPWTRPQLSPPSAYRRFLERGREYAAARGLPWPNHEGKEHEPHTSMDWDLRRLADSHWKYAVSLGGFEVDSELYEKARVAGWSLASMPSGNALSQDVVEFVMALVVHRCKSKKAVRVVRQLARNVKLFFSVNAKAPWEVSSEDVGRYLQLQEMNPSIHRDMRTMAKVINENMLSAACPIVVQDIDSNTWKQLQASLVERSNSEKLPERDSLYELARIVLRETPVTHSDLIRFAAVKVLLFTGLRINEVLMLPLDCLRWENHVDVVTGMPADQVGGVGRTLSLRYFAEKQANSAADLLIEEIYPVPERFHDVISSAIEAVVQATVPLRRLLAEQLQMSTPPERSDIRRFKTSAGKTITSAELLFLHSFGGRPEPHQATSLTAVTTLNPNAMYLALGLSTLHRKSSFFARYGAPRYRDSAIRPHSLRHMLNTELFRMGVSDTAITQQFGRQTVAQSYEYDHRTLSEKLAFVKLPESVKHIVKDGSPQELVAKMVVGGLSPKSHIAKTFVEIQASVGDEAAFKYLVASSDGFHVTPYGFCLNSFSMSPCPKHLKCFNGCKHFAASGLPEHRISLESLRKQLISMRDAAVAAPLKTVGKKNQIAHAESLLNGVDAALKAQPDTPVFGSNTDFSIPAGDVLS